MDGLWASAALIFVAEFGDRSQLMALMLAARVPARAIRVGATALFVIVGVVMVIGAVRG